MTYDEGRLRAWLDGELPAREAAIVERQVREDPELRRRVDELRARDRRSRYLLEELDVAPPPTARVRAAVHDARGASPGVGSAHRTEVTEEADHGTGHRWARRARLAQAAVLVLVFAGAAAAAIPGSPVREWLVRTLDSGPAPSEASAPADAAGPRAVEHETGMVVAPDDGRIRIELVGLPPGTEIFVQLTDEEGAGVFGPEGSGLELEGESGRIRARAAGGPIRVELPRGVPDADLLVDGRVYLLKRGGDVTLRVPPTDSSASGIRLRAGS